MKKQTTFMSIGKTKGTNITELCDTKNSSKDNKINRKILI